jgi:hypothetical protein
VPGQRERLGAAEIAYTIMNARFLTATFLVAFLTMAPSISAQEGHPLVGSWHGRWGATPEKQTDITLVISYDGKKATALLNPGLNSIEIAEITLDPSNWSIHFAVDGKDRSGLQVHVSADGKIENITNVRRSISGTWTDGSAKGSFKIVRDN